MKKGQETVLGILSEVQSPRDTFCDSPHAAYKVFETYLYSTLCLRLYHRSDRKAP